MSKDVRRAVRRKATRRAAWITCGSSELIPCVIWDFSEKGARITAAQLNLLPDYFTLILSRDQSERRTCRVVWREGYFAGVSFLTEGGARGPALSLVS